MAIGRICQREVDVASPEENVRIAAERMHQRTVGCLVAIDANRIPVGIITDRDLAIRVVAAGLDVDNTSVDHVMTHTPRTVREGTAIEFALSLMRGGVFRRLPVTNDDGELVGLVTLDDILLLLAEEFAHVRGVLERETPAGAAAKAG